MSRGGYKIDMAAVARLLARRPELRGIGITTLLEEVWTA